MAARLGKQIAQGRPREEERRHNKVIGTTADDFCCAAKRGGQKKVRQVKKGMMGSPQIPAIWQNGKIGKNITFLSEGAQTALTVK